MCGRYTLVSPPEELQREFELAAPPTVARARYNIAPTQPVLVILNRDARHAVEVRWGLVPFWAKDPSIGNRMINARIETLADKPSFRNALERRRCLVLADGFYEWKKDAGRKVPMYFRLKSGRPFGFAGLWEQWKSSDGDLLETCTIITTQADEVVAPIHERMPLILAPQARQRWLLPDKVGREQALEWLVADPAAAIDVVPVSAAVNSPANDGPHLLDPTG